jgi:DNA-binding response OmpR family regulator
MKVNDIGLLLNEANYKIPLGMSHGITKGDSAMDESILLLEGDIDLRRVITISLEQIGYRVFDVANAAHAFKILESTTPEILILELDVPFGNTGALIDAYRGCQGRVAWEGTVILTTTSRPGGAWRRKYKLDAVIYKPFDMRSLYGLLESQLQRKATRVY